MNSKVCVDPGVIPRQPYDLGSRKLPVVRLPGSNMCKTGKAGRATGQWTECVLFETVSFDCIPPQPGPDTGYCVSTNPTNSRCKFAARNPGLRHLLLHALIPHFVYRVVTSQDEEGGGAGDLGPICLEAWNTDSGDIPAGEDSDGIAERDFPQTSS